MRCAALKPHACVSCHVAVSAMRPEHMLCAAWQQAVHTEVATFLSFSACTRARIQCVPGRPRPNGTDYLTANLPASKMKHVYTRTLRHTKSASDFSNPSDARKATRRAEHVRMILSLPPSCVRACVRADDGAQVNDADVKIRCCLRRRYQSQDAD